MYRPVLVTPPVIKPVTLAEAKTWADISYTDKDAAINVLIGAATAHLDGWSGILYRCLCEQTWRQDFDDFRSYLRLDLFPVISITSVKYTDTLGDEQTVTAGQYTLKVDALGAYVEFKGDYSFPPLNAESSSVRVEYLAGYADVAGTPKTSSVPDDIKQAIVLLVRHWFDNPGAVVVGVTAQALPFGADSLLSKYRRPRF